MIRQMNRVDEYVITLEARKDIAWWGRCAHQYNGISLIWLHNEPQVDRLIATDACLIGYGGTYGQQYLSRTQEQ